MTISQSTGPRVIVALDYPSAEQALALVETLQPASCRLKVGKELFTREGPALVRTLEQAGFDVFLDLKFHDIPNTVAHACEVAADLGVWMLNVHASGGLKMMQAARQALEASGESRPLLIAVTVLTSLDDMALAEIGFCESAAVQVVRLAKLAQQAGLDGVVCSALEAEALRQALGPDFLLVTPGVRPAGAASDDQARIMTPADALRAGADYLVIGRPITQAAKPADALSAINKTIHHNFS